MLTLDLELVGLGVCRCVFLPVFEGWMGFVSAYSPLVNFDCYRNVGLPIFECMNADPMGLVWVSVFGCPYRCVKVTFVVWVGVCISMYAYVVCGRGLVFKVRVRVIYIGLL